METLCEVIIGTLLKLPRDRECYGYGTDPLRSGELFVKVTAITEQPHGQFITAKSAKGEVIMFAINTDEFNIYANTIDDLGIVED